MHEHRFTQNSGLPRIESAGGLIVNSSGCVLFILKGGKWDLPKGRLEQGKNHEETALREVVEETSIEPDLITVFTPLCYTWHVTTYSSREYLKKNRLVCYGIPGRWRQIESSD